ncbi:MAG: HNH endonuclease [Pseudomonadota bacterium]
MGKLSVAPSRLASAPARVARPMNAEGHSPGLEPWRRLYKLKAWQDLRQRVFLRDRYTCQCGCGTLITEPRERIADHKDPEAKLTEARFFDDDEVQTLWKPCHDGWKQRLERRARGG